MPLIDANLRWHRIHLELQPHNVQARKLHPLFVLRALLKGMEAGFRGIPVAFHVPDCPFTQLADRTAGKFPFEILLFSDRGDIATNWVDALSGILQTRASNHNLASPVGFELVQFMPVHPHSQPSAVELQLMTPLPFRRQKGDPYTKMSLDRFCTALHARAESLFQVRLEAPRFGDVALLTQYWDFKRIKAPSRSQPGSFEWLQGCVGPIWFKGEIGELLPWLQLAAQIHAGGKRLLNPLGYCTLSTSPTSHFDKELEKPEFYGTSLSKIMEANEGFLPELEPGIDLASDPGAIDSMCRSLASQVSAGEWAPAPSRMFEIPKRSGVRRVEKLDPATRWVHTALFGLLRLPLESHFLPASAGFRRGASTARAVTLVKDYIAAGYRYVVRTDIRECFASIDIDRLYQLLDTWLPPADERLRSLLQQCLRAPVHQNGLIKPRRIGLAEGSPLSPLLMNFYLHEFDREIWNQPGRMVRYADDIVLLAPTPDAARNLLAHAKSVLSRLGLELSDEKTVLVGSNKGFNFLGHIVGIESSRAQGSPGVHFPLRRALFITQAGYSLHNNGPAVEICGRGEPAKVIPLRRVSSINVLAPAYVTTGLMITCARVGVPIVLAQFGSLHTLVLPTNRGHLELSRNQAISWEAMGVAGRLGVAIRLVESKLKSYQYMLRQKYLPGTNKLLAFIDSQLVQLGSVTNCAALRGHEGIVARQVQRALDDRISAREFHFARRDRKGKDRMNPLLNFAYHLLATRVSSLLRSAGLDPWLGYLHDAGDAYESLTYDLLELFRAMADRTLLALVNRHELRSQHFRGEQGSSRLTHDGIQVLVRAMEEAMVTDVCGITPLLALETQIESMRRFAQGKSPLWVYVYGQSTASSYRK